MQFKDIKGQQVLSNRLTQIIDAGRISHAQLFVGETQSGGLALALAYMQYLCCQNRLHYDSGSELRADSCGHCPSCQQFEQLSHPDLHLFFPNFTTDRIKSKPSCADFQEEFRCFLNQHQQMGSVEQWYADMGVEKQGVIRVEDATAIEAALALKPYQSEYKMVLIWCADKMNADTANKLLKTLEEPDGRTLIILTADATDRMLPTILSRTQQITIPAIANNSHPEREQMTEWFVEWMRLLFKVNMVQLSAWVDRIAKEGRELQKQFLSFSLEALRQCFVQNVSGGAYQCAIDFGDSKFNQSFYTVITRNNIELMTTACNNTLYAIERNAYAAIAFMNLSLNLSIYIRKK